MGDIRPQPYQNWYQFRVVLGVGQKPIQKQNANFPISLSTRQCLDIVIMNP